MSCDSIKKKIQGFWNGLFFEEKFMLVCVTISVVCTVINVWHILRG